MVFMLMVVNDEIKHINHDFRDALLPQWRDEFNVPEWQHHEEVTLFA